ncbi:amidohydrolase family protein [Lignipirellula cremea]|uniref:Amidohydrolase n=1 Tax=Lignipirellula cremea TaxID=2528010 RepID=A0A518DU62_9BACT|nr:amidohydrolase family protein [Lignipirellula cremea]QDU95375.1 Amidohydrolase [Lignipirellula cremea]
MHYFRIFIGCALLASFWRPLAHAEEIVPAAPSAEAEPLDGRDGRDLTLSNFRPESKLKVDAHHLRQAKFPVVDIHTHFRHRFRHSQEQLEEFVDLMDRHQIAICVSLDGQLGEELEEHKKYLWTKYPDRFVIFANIDWQGSGEKEKPSTWACNRPGFGERMAAALADAKKRGASGLKIFKGFGLEYKNADGSLLKIDDPRFDPIWKACGELDFPVLIHVADPAAFFDPIDEKNERWEELHRHPEWSFYGDAFPSREELLAARNRVIQRHPSTKFIGAHVANNAEDLKTVAAWLKEYPNLYVDFASRIGELGRQPYTARKFLIDHADRVLFSTDGPWPEKRISLYWRFLETYDEEFPYSEKDFPPQGFWNIYGVGLPDQVLQQIYHENAARLIPGVKEKLNRWRERSEGAGE